MHESDVCATSLAWERAMTRWLWRAAVLDRICFAAADPSLSAAGESASSRYPVASYASCPALRPYPLYSLLRFKFAVETTRKDDLTFQLHPVSKEFQ